MSDPFYKQDVFFFVTTIAIVLVTILLTVLMVYLIKITRDVKYISKKAKEEADLISEDLSELRDNIHREGVKLKYFSKFFQNLNRKAKK